jgi:hypothetical protein
LISGEELKVKDEETKEKEIKNDQELKVKEEEIEKLKENKDKQTNEECLDMPVGLKGCLILLIYILYVNYVKNR